MHPEDRVGDERAGGGEGRGEPVGSAAAGERSGFVGLAVVGGDGGVQAEGWGVGLVVCWD
jgi:hypothetical protein